MFPLIEKTRTTEASTHDLRRYLRQVNMAYCGAMTCLPMPESGRFGALHIQERILPSARLAHTHITNRFCYIPYTDGSNVQEVLFSTLEGLIKKMSDCKEAEDAQALISITSMLRNIIDDKGIDSGERNSMASQTEYIFSHLNDPMLIGKKITINAFDSYLYKIHLDYVCCDDTLHYYPFQQKVFGQMVDLALKDYPEVRDTARSELNHLFNIYNEARRDAIDKMAETFLDKSSSIEKRRRWISFGTTSGSFTVHSNRR